MNQVTLNFGPSPYQGGTNSLPEEDQIIEIPVDGGLDTISLGIREYLMLSVTRKTIRPEKTDREFTGVVISFLTQGSYDFNRDVLIVWIPERHEWVAIEYSRWQENSYSDDELYSGPSSLDDFCEDKLALAYQLIPTKSNRGLLKRYSPQELLDLRIEQFQHSPSFEDYVKPEPQVRNTSTLPYNLLQNHIFLSYVKEDSKIVLMLHEELTKRGHRVWLDRYALEPGVDWRIAIEHAIKNGMYFIACFSQNYWSKSSSYMNEELQIAIEQLRMMPDDKIWFIPIKLSECNLPVFNIRSGKAIDSKQWVELYKDWQDGIERISNTLKAKSNIESSKK